MNTRTGYKIIVGRLDDDNIPHLQKELNELAFDGWRVVSTFIRPDGMWVVLLEKRVVHLAIEPGVFTWKAQDDD